MTGPTDPRLDDPVYRPADDSFLLTEAAEAVISPGATVVDTGTGSGIVADWLKETLDVRVVATDINPYACREAAARGLDVARMSLLDGIADGAVDAAVFNPPYLPADDRLPDDWLTRATTGGPTGTEVVVEWLADLPRVLAPDGVGVFVVSSLTDLEAVTAAARDHGLTTEELDAGSYPFERLVVHAVRRDERVNRTR